MSLDYYIHTKDVNLAFNLLPRVKMDKDNREFVAHICQVSVGCKPVFERHDCCGSFIDLVSMLTSSQYEFVIKDVYGLIIDNSTFIKHMTKLQSDGEFRELSPDSYYDVDGFMFLDYGFGVRKGEVDD